MIAIGIDPGQAGGIAALTHEGLLVTVEHMPETERELLDIFVGIRDRQEVDGRPFAMLERVGASPQMGVVSAFTFGRGFGALRMALTASRIPFDLVAPGVWQQAMGCRTKGDKNVSKHRAQELFPSLKVTHAIADALLIAEFCRRQGFTCPKP